VTEKENARNAAYGRSYIIYEMFTTRPIAVLMPL